MEDEVRLATEEKPKKSHKKIILPTKGINLEILDTEVDFAMNNFVETEVEAKLQKQRDIDNQSDHQDKISVINSTKAKEREDMRVEEEIQKRGKVLANGKVSNKIGRPEVDPTKTYKNHPIKTIEGQPVVFLGARPFWDKACEWDNGYQDQYEHFTESDHPMYYNAVIAKVKYTDHNRRVLDAWVVSTDKEKLLYIKR